MSGVTVAARACRALCDAELLRARSATRSAPERPVAEAGKA